MPDHDLLTAKISRGFDHLDLDGDGQLTEHDHVLMGWRVAASLGHVEGSAAEQRIVDAYLHIWRDLHLPYIADGGTAISRERFLISTRSLADDPVAARATLGALAEAFLAIADADNDGQIGPAEFLGFQRGHFPMLSRVDADDAFAHLDRDGDGYLSATEVTEAIIEFLVQHRSRRPRQLVDGPTGRAPFVTPERFDDWIALRYERLWPELFARTPTHLAFEEYDLAA